MVLRAADLEIESISCVSAFFVPNPSPVGFAGSTAPRTGAGPAAPPALAVIIASGLVSTGGCRRPFASFFF